MTTAIIRVHARNGTLIDCRTLLDTCSTANFITAELARELQLKRTRCSVPVGALNSLHTTCNHYTTTTIQSKHSILKKTLNFFIVQRISTLIPNENLNREHISIPANIKLADPGFNKPAPVQMLIGTGPTLSFLSIGQIRLATTTNSDLILQKTLLGWIIGGSIPSNSNQQSPSLQTSHHSDVQFELERFWKIEEGSTTPHRTIEEMAAETHFQTHVKRSLDGRYVVALPFKNNSDDLGDSRKTALRRFHSLEHKLNTNPTLREEYTSIIQEYINLGHLSIADEGQSGYYLPHHAVIKESSQTTRIRVVFDGSAKTTTGVSLNDILMVGPTIQTNINSLILRFRLHKYVLTGDIEKMYRQFLIREEDSRFQRIFWRDIHDNIITYQLNTVTFGLSAAPFLATRCLQQLAEDESTHFPIAAETLKRDQYVDELLTGTRTRKEAMTLRDEIIQLLQRGGVHIRQWASNDPTLLQGLPEGSTKLSLHCGEDKTLKTLGIFWNSQDDSITYSVKPINLNNKITKRTILSEIAKIFDPLGLLGPVIIVAKILVQQLWSLKLDWDESVPSTIYTTWHDYCTQLHILNNISFPRKVSIDDATEIQIHGFCDASERAYGACIYLRSTTAGQVQGSLLCARSKVAPLKVVSLPRLELCGALLLAKLCNSVTQAINIKPTKTILWTDSTITLHWIQTQPTLLKTFIVNRVSEIQQQTTAAYWRHIPSEQNPADLLSRGSLPREFMRHSTWRNGPSWMTKEESQWPEERFIFSTEIPEIRRQHCLITKLQSHEIWSRFSSLNKLTRTIAYCLRFKKSKHSQGPLQLEELTATHNRIIWLVQRECFYTEIEDLKKNREVSHDSKLLTLNPFLDNKGLIRVGGRLRHSKLSYNRKHPIILPGSHHVTTLIITHHHICNLHTGILSTLHNIRQRYWLLDGRNQVRNIIRKCLKCLRLCPQKTNCIMGDLPAARVTEGRPFQTVGIDYCGPFFIKEKRFRNRKGIKIYVAVFICLAVKAVHLEVVSDMTTEAFVAALRRFIARRGKCDKILSDNGSNFIGAHHQLNEIYDLFHTENNRNKIEDIATQEGISWTFIPPRSPNFGGIWEAAVKSMKQHLKRVIGETLFTFEEFTTITTQIEAVLNSRPLTPLSSDPNDLSALTPGHFLIGQPLTDFPDSDFRQVPANRLSRWQHIQKLRRDFWVRWHKEYLNGLNVRSKWTRGSHSIQEGSLVIIRDDNQAPLHWKLGRVTQVHPGSDGIIRTVTIKTPTTSIVRNIRGISPLPSV